MALTGVLSICGICFQKEHIFAIAGCLHLSSIRLTDPSLQKAVAERFEAEEPPLSSAVLSSRGWCCNIAAPPTSFVLAAGSEQSPKAAAPVSRQAHALLDIDAIGGGLEQQPSQLLAAMHSSRGCEPRRRRTSQPHRLLRELRAEESASGWPVWNPTELCEIPASRANGRGGGGSPRFLVPLHVDAVGRAPAEQPAAAGGRRRSRSRLFHSVLCTKLQHMHDLTCSSSRQEAAPVSRQAHALLDSDGNGEGLGQQHSELLPCLRHVGVSRGTVLLPNSTVTTSGCVRWRVAGGREEGVSVDAVGRVPAEQPAAAGGWHRPRSRLVHSVLSTKLQHTHDLTCSSSTQAHALLYADCNGGGLGQQHSELLPCLCHVGVSRGTVLLPNSAVTTSGCVRCR
ncbi:hypothetical protein V5799_033353, partial [Amblyomma americanum]